ncbi:MAG: hypothetical protein EBT42_05535 [Actinobacteria bacterium]|nr:hypothetical protein [Actinomycetota bacterium]
MQTKRAHHLPWRRAGNLADNNLSADDVVRETGWVFNNETGNDLTLKEFVDTGDKEVQRYIRLLELGNINFESSTLLEIGSGIGRMTSAFTNRCEKVIAADVDSAFLERCRQTVARFGRIDRLNTLHVVNGRTLTSPCNIVSPTTLLNLLTKQSVSPKVVAQLCSIFALGYSAMSCSCR